MKKKKKKAVNGDEEDNAKETAGLAGISEFGQADDEGEMPYLPLG